MQPTSFNLLIIGGCTHEADHLPSGKTFVRQLTRRLAQPRRFVRVDQFPSALLPAAVDLLAYLPLPQYDLILLRPESPGGQLPSWRTLPARLTKALIILRPVRHRVVVLTPFPHRGLVERAHRQLNGMLWSRLVRRAGYRLFNTGRVVKARDEYFVTDDSARLNAISHELLAQELFEYYQAVPTVLAAQSIEPPSEP